MLIYYQKPKDTALSIGKQAPIPNQTAKINPRIKTKLAIGRRNGFWNLFTFSIKGTVANPKGTAAIASTPNNLFGKTLNKLNVGKKYHSGKISNGVLNGSAGSPNCVGDITPKPIQQANVPKIQTGKTYNKSFGHAGSP
uniref:Cytochrome b6/f complex subunit IV n=1 Tax=Acanthoceras zachariasii TaxID=451788 RepID=A0A2U9NTE3_9STRA|nr:cytochrome b6/f complex subunit IV [Acanthoceras zachariasii]AWT40401.1 cytochrome b6/f complex subunit IV [Acanthoceras zachariasii]